MESDAGGEPDVHYLASREIWMRGNRAITPPIPGEHLRTGLRIAARK